MSINTKFRWVSLVIFASIIGLTLGKGIVEWMKFTGTPPPPIRMKTLHVAICPPSDADFGDVINKAFKKNKDYQGLLELDICQGDFISHTPIILSGVTSLVGSGSGTITNYVDNNQSAIYMTGKGLVRIINTKENIWVPKASSKGYWIYLEGNTVWGEATNNSVNRDVTPSYAQYAPLKMN